MLALLAVAAVQATAAPTQPIVATAPLTDRADATATFAARDGAGLLTVVERGRPPARMAVASATDALALLADRRFEPLWPAILAWGGPGLTRIRDARLAEARALAARGATQLAFNTGASTVRPPVRAAMLLAGELFAAGRVADAEAVLRRARGAAPAAGDDWGAAEWTVMSLRLGGMRVQQGDIPGALAELAASEPPVAATLYAINFGITRAGWLVEQGEYARGLAALDAAGAGFAGLPGRKAESERIPGSDLQFAWIRACALHGLGRDAEARPYRAILDRAAQATDRTFIIPPVDGVRMRYQFCVRDAGAAARLFATELTTQPANGAVLSLQPGKTVWHVDPAFMARVRAEPVLRDLLARRMRELPPDLIPALNQWRP